MTDRDALAQEFLDAVTQSTGTIVDDLRKCAEIALRHIEAAGAEKVELEETVEEYGGIITRMTRFSEGNAKEIARLRAALKDLLAEWDKFSRYGSPIAKAANEAVTKARAALERPA